jgi:hypothetical protein
MTSDLGFKKMPHPWPWLQLRVLMTARLREGDRSGERREKAEVCRCSLESTLRPTDCSRCTIAMTFLLLTWVKGTFSNTMSLRSVIREVYSTTRGMGLSGAVDMAHSKPEAVKRGGLPHIPRSVDPTDIFVNSKPSSSFTAFVVTLTVSRRPGTTD